MLLVSCSAATEPTVKNEDKDYTYVTKLPGASAFNAKYVTKAHELSPLTRYHFSVAVPRDWEVLDFTIKAEPEPNGFSELGVFRAPGAWQQSDAKPGAELTISTVNVQGNAMTAAAWLNDLIAKNVPNPEILETHTVKTADGEAIDMLLRYKDKDDTIMNRMAAFRKSDRIYLVSGSDTPNGYRDNAEVFYAAIATFKLKNEPSINPFYLAPPVAATGSAAVLP